MTPQDLIQWTFAQNEPTIVSTSFGEHSAALLHMVCQIKPDAVFLWLDTQFNTRETLEFKKNVSQRFNLNLKTYVGEFWTNNIPKVDTPEFRTFVTQVKLAPFHQAMKELAPVFWISGIRREQTDFRRQIKSVNQVEDIVKVSPLLDWTTKDMERYLKKYDLPNEPHYYDPTKPKEHGECGIHTARPDRR